MNKTIARRDETAEKQGVTIGGLPGKTRHATGTGKGEGSVRVGGSPERTPETSQLQADVNFRFKCMISASSQHEILRIFDREMISTMLYV